MKPKPKQQVVSQEPWAPGAQAAQDFLSRAQGLAGGGMYSPETQQAQEMAMGQVSDPQSLLNLGLGQFQQTLGGRGQTPFGAQEMQRLGDPQRLQQLTGQGQDLFGRQMSLLNDPSSLLNQPIARTDVTNDPRLQSMMDRAMSSADARFSLAGRSGSGLHGQNRFEMAAPILMDQYNRERQLEAQDIGQRRGMTTNLLGQMQGLTQAGIGQERGLQEAGIGRERGLQEQGIGRERGFQESAIGRAPGMAQIPSGIMGQVGAQRDPMQSLQQYGGLISPFVGLGSQQTSPLYRNQGAGALGGAATGAGIGSMMGLSNPWTAGLALGGGLLGMY